MEILLIDDIQFLAKKEQTQEEFSILSTLSIISTGEIVISSDRPPKDPHAGGSPAFRFEWGLITDIQSPDLETRIAILRKKALTED